MSRHYWIGLILLASAMPQLSHAGQSVSAIAATAALFAEDRAVRQGLDAVNVNVRPLDSRISLSECSSPLKTSSPGERVLGPVTVAVKCMSPAPWTVHVRATVTATVEMPVLARTVNRGDVIGRYDIEWRSQEIATHLVGYLNDERSIIGKEARKHLRPGSPLRASDLISPQIIDRGQTVDLVARSSGLVVNMQGTALANGAEGDRLLVKNLSSGKKVEGLVMAGGTVLIQ